MITCAGLNSDRGLAVRGTQPPGSRPGGTDRPQPAALRRRGPEVCSRSHPSRRHPRAAGHPRAGDGRLWRPRRRLRHLGDRARRARAQRAVAGSNVGPRHRRAHRQRFSPGPLLVVSQLPRRLRTVASLRVGRFTSDALDSVIDPPHSCARVPCTARVAGASGFRPCCRVKHRSSVPSLLKKRALRVLLLRSPLAFNAACGHCAVLGARTVPRGNATQRIR